MTAKATTNEPVGSSALPSFQGATRAIFLTFGVLSLLIVIIAASLLSYGLRHGPTTYSGVHSAGVDIGSMTQEEAESRIAARIDEVGLRQLVLTGNDRQWVIPVEEMGITFDAATTAERAYQIGRTGNFWVDSRTWLAALITGYDVPVQFSIDSQAVVDALGHLAPELTVAARDARFSLDANGMLIVEEAVPGVGIDVIQTLGNIRANLGSLSSDPVGVALAPVDAGLMAHELEGSFDQVALLASQPLFLEHDGDQWEISSETLLRMVSLTEDAQGKVEVEFVKERLARTIEHVADQVKFSSRSANVAWQDGQFIVVPSVDGGALDADATATEAIRVMQSGERRVALQFGSIPAEIIDGDAQSAARVANDMVAQPVRLSWDGGEAELSPEAVARSLRFERRPNESVKLGVVADLEVLQTALQELAPQVEVAAVDAELRYLDGAVVVRQSEKAGVELDIEASASAVWEALQNGSDTVALVTNTVEPQVTAASAGDIRIPDRLSNAATSYSGSVENRKHNVELAVERANGALIPPGGVYSFVDTVGNVDLDSGYKVGYGIVATSNGAVSTVPSVGGGICQVSTTVFHAAFWAGMPIVERSWHFYWIPLYGQQPSGLTGLDATVDTDYGLDFKFRNTTENWLAVVASADGEQVRFELWGTDPGWTIDVDEPVVTNVVPADQTMQYRETDQLAAGTSTFVERAEDGFTVVIHRRVRKGEEVVDDLSLRSNYVPSQNVTLVGTR